MGLQVRANTASQVLAGADRTGGWPSRQPRCAQSVHSFTGTQFHRCTVSQVHNPKSGVSEVSGVRDAGRAVDLVNFLGARIAIL
jgi:hypothetical protein